MELLRTKSDIVKDIPVANGKIIQSLIHASPRCLLNRFKTIDLSNCTIKLDPIAFGYKAFTSPDLPIPWARPKFLSQTILENILPSRSPTPQLPS